MRRLFFFVAYFLAGVYFFFLLSEGFVLRAMCLAFLLFYYLFNEYLFVCLIAFCLGVLRIFIFFEFQEGFDEKLYGKVAFDGCIVEEPDVRSSHVKYVFGSEEFDGRVLVNYQKYPALIYGECFKVTGVLKEPFTNEDFDYRSYLRRYSIYGVMYDPYLEKVGEGRGSVVFEAIFGLKNMLNERFDHLFTEPYGSFVKGILLGSRAGIDPRIMEGFGVTGLTHIIAVSGYNMTLIVLFINNFFAFVSVRKRYFIGLFLIVVFVILVGAGSAVVRAAIMAIISLSAVYFGRLYLAFAALLLSAFFMILFNPLILIFDVGFQLSFLATLALLLLAKIEYPKSAALEILVISLSVQLLILPISFASFEGVSLVAPVANLFVLPFLPVAMLLGFAAIFGGGFFAFLTSVVLGVVLKIVEICAAVPFAFVEIGLKNWYFAFFYYWILYALIRRFFPQVFDCFLR